MTISTNVSSMSSVDTAFTSGVTAISLIGLLIYGVGSIQDFAAAMMFGIATGTYSSIYVAGPFALWYDHWMKLRDEKRRGGGKKPPKPPPSASAPNTSGGRKSASASEARR